MLNKNIFKKSNFFEIIEYMIKQITETVSFQNKKQLI